VGASCDTGDEASIHDIETRIVPSFKEIQNSSISKEDHGASVLGPEGRFLSISSPREIR
jgi:hypothetical protein